MVDPHAAAGVAKTGGPFGWIKGRASRREYWTQLAALFLVSFLFGPMFRALGIVLTVFLMLIQIRRVHDMGRTGWWAVAATVVPIVLIAPVLMVASLDVATITGVILELLLIVAIGAPPGDADENRFGPPPPFTLLRLLTGR